VIEAQGGGEALASFARPSLADARVGQDGARVSHNDGGTSAQQIASPVTLSKRRVGRFHLPTRLEQNVGALRLCHPELAAPKVPSIRR